MDKLTQAADHLATINPENRENLIKGVIDGFQRRSFTMKPDESIENKGTNFNARIDKVSSKKQRQNKKKTMKFKID